MNGRRVQPDEYGWLHRLLEPGDFCKVQPTHMQDGEPLEEWINAHYPQWIACSPNGHLCSLARHTIVEHEDGAITVSPSILISDGKGTEFYHGFLEHGVWRTC